MKALITTEANNGFLNASDGKTVPSSLTGLVLSLIELQADEILIASPSALKNRLLDWHERECGRASVPITLRFYNEACQSRETDPIIRLIRRECLSDSVLMVSFGGRIPAFGDFKKALYLYPHLPLVGVRRPDHLPSRGAVSIGERNRITRFSTAEERRTNEWEPVGVSYFPERFLLDGISAFVKSHSVNGQGFDAFLSWSVRNFKVYAHVFAAHSGQ